MLADPEKRDREVKNGLEIGSTNKNTETETETAEMSSEEHSEELKPELQKDKEEEEELSDENVFRVYQAKDEDPGKSEAAFNFILK